VEGRWIFGGPPFLDRAHLGIVSECSTWNISRYVLVPKVFHVGHFLL
jgi:hypothetical protein